MANFTTSIFNKLFRRDPEAAGRSRLEKLTARLGRTEAGRTLLDYAKDNIDITLGAAEDRNFNPDTRRYALCLDGRQSDDMLLAALARQIRDARGYENAPLPLGLCAPREQVLALRIKEADAAASTLKFLEDHARATGDHGPLQANFRPEIRQEMAEKTDYARLQAFNTRLAETDYDAEILGRYQQALSLSPPLPLLTQNESISALQSFIWERTTVWPFAAGTQSSYLPDTLEGYDTFIRDSRLPHEKIAEAHHSYAAAGSVQDKAEEARLDALKAKIGVTQAGKHLLDFAAREDIAINFDHHRLSAESSTGQFRPRDSAIFLNAHNTSDARLALALVHELRHAWQQRQVGEDFSWDAPSATLVCNKFEEADAHAFEQAFAENHARETGDSPLIDALRERTRGTLPDPGEGATPLDRVKAWMKYLEGRDFNYDRRTLDVCERALDLRDKKDPMAMKRTPPTPAAHMARALSHARAADSFWPLEPEGSPGYLSTLTDAEMIRMGTSLATQEERERLSRIDKAYERHFATPPPSRLSPSFS